MNTFCLLGSGRICSKQDLKGNEIVQRCFCWTHPAAKVGSTKQGLKEILEQWKMFLGTKRKISTDCLVLSHIGGSCSASAPPKASVITPTAPSIKCSVHAFPRGIKAWKTAVLEVLCFSHGFLSGRSPGKGLANNCPVTESPKGVQAGSSGRRGTSHSNNLVQGRTKRPLGRCKEHSSTHLSTREGDTYLLVCPTAPEFERQNRQLPSVLPPLPPLPQWVPLTIQKLPPSAETGEADNREQPHLTHRVVMLPGARKILQPSLCWTVGSLNPTQRYPAARFSQHFQLCEKCPIPEGDVVWMEWGYGPSMQFQPQTNPSQDSEVLSAACAFPPPHKEGKLLTHKTSSCCQHAAKHCFQPKAFSSTSGKAFQFKVSNWLCWKSNRSSLIRSWLRQNSPIMWWSMMRREGEQTPIISLQQGYGSICASASQGLVTPYLLMHIHGTGIGQEGEAGNKAVKKK